LKSNNRTTGANVRGREGNSPDCFLRSLKFSKCYRGGWNMITIWR